MRQFCGGPKGIRTRLRRRGLRRRPDDWRGVLRGHVVEACGLLRTLMAGKIVFTLESTATRNRVEGGALTLSTGQPRWWPHGDIGHSHALDFGSRTAEDPGWCVAILDSDDHAPAEQDSAFVPLGHARPSAP